jgi:hypothetical protein
MGSINRNVMHGQVILIKTERKLMRLILTTFLVSAPKNFSASDDKSHAQLNYSGSGCYER